METKQYCSINEITELKKEPADVKAFLLVLKCGIFGNGALLAFGSMFGGIMFIFIGIIFYVSAVAPLSGVRAFDIPLFPLFFMAIMFVFGIASFIPAILTPIMFWRIKETIKQIEEINVTCFKNPDGDLHKHLNELKDILKSALKITLIPILGTLWMIKNFGKFQKKATYLKKNFDPLYESAMNQMLEEK